MKALKLILAGLPLALLLTSCTTALGARLPSAGIPEVVVDVPMLFRGPTPAVEVYVNGEGPFLFIIDTGAQGQARADIALVSQLRLQSRGSGFLNDGSGRNSKASDEVQLDRIRIGTLEFRKVRASSRDYNRSPKLPRIHGILGFDLFDHHLLQLDFPNKRVRVLRGSLPGANGRTVLDFEAPYDTPIVEMSASGFRLSADIDTGDTGSISFPSALARALPHASEAKAAGVARSVSNEFQTFEVKLRNNLRLGTHEFLEPTIRFNDLHDNINLGAGFFSGFRVTFDQTNSRVELIKSESD